MEDSMTRKLRVVRKQSSNGEIHLILEEYRLDDNRKNAEDFDMDRLKKIMKEEASRPLLILREE
jgi:hypothetical protein